MSWLDFGVFLVATTLPILLLWFGGFVAGKSVTLSGSSVLVAMGFGAGITLVNHATAFLVAS